MTEVARYSTPEGDVVVWRNPTVSYGVRWLVDAPGQPTFDYGFKREAMRAAAAAARVRQPPPPRFDLVKAWEKVRSYG